MGFALEHPSDVFTVGALVRLRDTTRDVRVDVLPARGGMIVSMDVKDRPVLYLDTETVNDVSKNVRGGVPILFPFAGRLPGDVWQYKGAQYAMKQHGFARNRVFEVRNELVTAQRAAVTVGLHADDATRAVFPFEFDLELTYELTERGLTIETRVRNESDDAMPLHLGFHPYFHVPRADKTTFAIGTNATRAFNNVRKETEAFPGFALGEGETDLHLLDNTQRAVVMQSRSQPAVTLQQDAAFQTLVVWTLPDKDFVCVEPWTGPANTLHSENVPWIASWTTHATRWSIDV